MKNKDEITTELSALGAGILAGHSAGYVFQVPENYFGQFPGLMMDTIRHMNSDASLDVAIEKSGPFLVPAQYFDTLHESILSKVKAMDRIVQGGTYSWGDQDRENPFTVPENYFQEFESNLLNRIFHEEEDVNLEIESIAPLLAGLKKETTFTVPENYFNSEAFTREVKQQETKTKVIQHPSVKSIKWARWAAAAAVMAIFTLGGFHYLSRSSSVATGPSFEESLAQIPDSQIKEWLSSNMDESDINNLGGSIANIKSITTTHSLSEFSEKEIKEYLETEVW